MCYIETATVNGATTLSLFPQILTSIKCLGNIPCTYIRILHYFICHCSYSLAIMGDVLAVGAFGDNADFGYSTGNFSYNMCVCLYADDFIIICLFTHQGLFTFLSCIPGTIHMWREQSYLPVTRRSMRTLVSALLSRHHIFKTR